MNKSVMDQPDFHSLFYQREYVPLHYLLRFDSNHAHDIVFLDSYLHDATLFLKDIIINKQKLSIPLERVCWETYRPSQDSGTDGCRSELICYPVTNYSYYISQKFFNRGNFPQQISMQAFDFQRKDKYSMIILSLAIPDSAAQTTHQFRLEIELKNIANPLVLLQDISPNNL